MVELLEIQRFLPLPYEAALEHRLRRAQERMQALPGRDPALPALWAQGERIRRECRWLLVVDGGGAGTGIRGVLAALGLRPSMELRLLGGLPGGEALEDALALAARGNGALLAVNGGEGTPAFSLLRECLGENSRVLAEDRPETAALLVLAACGVDAEALLRGAAQMGEICQAASFANPAWRYAAARRQLCRAGYAVELLSCWDGALAPLLKWVQQRFAASEGKGNRPPLPVVTDYSEDFQTLGQYIQAGPRLFFETALRSAPAGDALEDLRRAAARETCRAHLEGGVPQIAIDAGEGTAESLGRLLYFFQYACGLSACLLDADPRNGSGGAPCGEAVPRAWRQAAARPAAGTGIL
ncbi:MAG: hypothetical protein HFG00_11360 [Oscillibacter sp.]|nr:hypothetical protein [Oscillibacter sp.]